RREEGQSHLPVVVDTLNGNGSTATGLIPTSDSGREESSNPGMQGRSRVREQASLASGVYIAP
ncbi:MAG: hypothetical protein L0Y56_06720, partial [Nitrospira sp.]|nr:hypothetical protein [Nitrospira sp.]